MHQPFMKNIQSDINRLQRLHLALRHINISPIFFLLIKIALRYRVLQQYIQSDSEPIAFYHHIDNRPM